MTLASPRVRVIDASNSEWDDLLGGRRDIYHARGFHVYEQSSGQGTARLVVVCQGPRGLAWPYLTRPLDTIPGLSGSGWTDVTSVYGYPGPIAWGDPDDDFLHQAWQTICHVWREQGAIAAFTRFNPILENVAIAQEFRIPHGDDVVGPNVIALGSTVSIDCRLSRDDSQQLYARVVRQEIAAARRAGLVTDHDFAWGCAAEFLKVYGEAMSRLNAAARYLLSADDLTRLRRSLGDHVHLLVTRAANRLAAAGLFTESDGIVQAHLVGTSDEFRALSPLKVLLDDAREWARERGAEVLHLGGGLGGRDDKLLEFKSRFSPRRHRFHIGRWILLHDAYREACHDVGALATLDPGHYFPAYRAPQN